MKPPVGRWKHVDDPRPIGIVHARADRSIALRLLGDARSLGVSGVLVAPGETPEECAARRAELRGLLLVHTGSVWWSDAQLAEVAERIAAGGIVAVARMTESKYPPPLAGLPVLLLSGRRYQTDPAFLRPGHTFVAEAFGVGPDPGGEARRGYVFVSYRGKQTDDVAWVANGIVPALAEQGFGLFDYRATEELDERHILAEHDRWLERCAAFLVVATDNWHSSKYTRYELRTARALGRPVIAVRRASAPSTAAPVEPVDGSVLFSTPERDGPILATTIRDAIARAGENTWAAAGRRGHVPAADRGTDEAGRPYPT